MPYNIPIMPFIVVILLLLPMRLSSLQLKGLAFFLWLVGGLILAWRGANYLFNAPERPDMVILAVIVVVSLAIGWAKGKFILSKTSQRNIARLDAFTEPMRPIYVYGLRSWIVIAIMVAISLCLNLLPANTTTLIIRGAVNLGIGMGLIISSLAYIRALVPAEEPTYPVEPPHMDPGVGP